MENINNLAIEKLEDLINTLTNDRDEHGNIKDLKTLNEACELRLKYYQKYGNPHEKEIDKKSIIENAIIEKTSKFDITNALNSIQLVDRETNYKPDSYIDFETVS